MSNKDNEKDGVGTTGHSWDGIEEYNNPLPRWWLWTFYATIIFALIYVILFPAWPMVSGATKGVLGYSSRGAVTAEMEHFAEMNAPLDAELEKVDLVSLTEPSELNQYAINGGAALFKTFCIQCHGSGAAGAKGYPNLLDNDWLWGGDIEAIYTTIAHGIRSDADDDTRYSEMSQFIDILEKEEIAQVVEFVLSLSDQEHDAELAQAGAVVFEDNCASCHAEDGTGLYEFGAPNLTDAIWLYGGDRETVTQTVKYSRQGVMPNWADRLSEAELRQLSLYVHQLGGGE